MSRIILGMLIAFLIVGMVLLFRHIDYDYTQLSNNCKLHGGELVLKSSGSESICVKKVETTP